MLQIKFYEAIKEYEKMETIEERLQKAKEIYDHHIMVEMLAHSHVRSYRLPRARPLSMRPRRLPLTGALAELHEGVAAARAEAHHEGRRAAQSVPGSLARLSQSLFSSCTIAAVRQ